MNLGAFMNPEFPIFSTTLCYLERDDAYLMLHRIKKQDDYNHDKWIGVGGKPGGLSAAGSEGGDRPDAEALPRPGSADLYLGQHDRVHPPVHR